MEVITSADGHRVVVADIDDQIIYASADIGRTWKNVASPSGWSAWYDGPWSTLAGSYDLTFIGISNFPRAFKIVDLWDMDDFSTAEWGALTVDGASISQGFVVASDGSKAIALDAAGGVYTILADGSYSKAENTPAVQWYSWIGASLASSGSGKRLYAVPDARNGADVIYVSKNYGATWYSSKGPVQEWMFVTSSFSGHTFYAAGGDGIYKVDLVV